MNLAEAAHTQALRDANPPPEPQRPARAGMPAYTPPPTRAAYDRTLASNFFQEFSRCVRQAILLAARLDSGAYDDARPIPNFTERTSHHEAPHHAPAQPRQPSDETRIHHERLEDEIFDEQGGDPDLILQTIAHDLDTAIEQTRAAGLDLSPRRADASPPPRPANAPSHREKPDPARATPSTRPATETQTKPRASPA